MEPQFGQKIIRAFAQETSISDTITDSFDDFVGKQISELFSASRPLTCVYYTADGEKKLSVRVLQHRLLSPMVIEPDSTSRQVFPHECRLRNLTYSGPLYVNVHCEVEQDGKKTEEVLNDVYVGRIPIMIYSKLCHVKKKEDRVKNNECEYDVGAYFVINGKEKVLITQTGGLVNRMMLYKSKKSAAVAVQSEKLHRMFVTTIKFFNPKKPITITFPRLQEETPAITVLMAMGFTLDDIKNAFTSVEMTMLHGSFNSLPADLEEAKRRVGIREVYNVGQSHEERLDKAFCDMLVPHIPLTLTGNKLNDKGIYIVKMIKELLLVANGGKKPSDRDSVINQRFHSSYTLLSTLFLQLLITWSENLKKDFTKILSKTKKRISYEKIRQTISLNNTITDGFVFALGTGTFNTKSVNKRVNKGVSQALARGSFMSGLSQIRKVSSAVDPEMNKNIWPRILKVSHYGRFCPAETPEGKSVGLEKNLAIGAYISLETDSTQIEEILQQYLSPNTITMLPNNGHSHIIDVYLNGKLMGNTVKEDRLIHTIRSGRRCGQFEKDVSISLYKNLIHISTTSGRLCRPLLVVSDGKLLYREEEDLTWNTMLRKGVIEYLDAEEEQTTYIAFFKRTIEKDHTHCEISNTLINGLNAASIPFSDRNPAPRNTFQSAMGKQSQGLYCTNYQLRNDTTSNVMYYGQKPLVQTFLAKSYKLHEMTSGLNAIVAIMPRDGYNQEDSIIVNEDSLMRGLFRADHLTTVEDTAVCNTKEKSTFKPPTRKRKIGNYSLLDKDGVVHPGTKITKKDCIIGKTFVRSEHKNSNVVLHEEDQSTLTDKDGYVQRVNKFQGRKGSSGVKIKIRTRQIPKIGDKFSSRHGQKGTIGMLVRQVDMPFTMDGTVPDIIINPCAIPSRMTIGHILETLTGKAVALSGKDIDGSPFTGLQIDDVAKVVQAHGFQKHGNECMMNGKTGEMMKVPIFLGPIFYQRLKHMVDYKYHARGRSGKKDELTRQPNQGRAAGGALKVGEMEKDTMGSHGAAGILEDRMSECSDKHTTYICRNCHQPAAKSGCKGCDGADTDEIEMPYAASLLFQELKAMSIKTNLHT